MRFETADFYQPVIRRADAGQAVGRQAIASRGSDRVAALCRFLNEHVTHAQVVEPPQRGIEPSPLSSASCIRTARPAAVNLSGPCVRKRRFSFVADRKKTCKSAQKRGQPFAAQAVAAYATELPCRAFTTRKRRVSMPAAARACLPAASRVKAWHGWVASAASLSGRAPALLGCHPLALTVPRVARTSTRTSRRSLPVRGR